MHEPIDVGAFRVMTENGIEYLLLDMRGTVGFCQIDEMRGEFRHRFIMAQCLQQGDMFVQIDKIQETVIYFTRVIPHIHRADQAELKDQEEEPFQQLDGIENKKCRFNAHEHGDDRAYQPERQMFHITQEIIHQDGGHQHSHGNGKSIGRSHRLRSLKIEHDKKTAQAKHPVDAGDIDLAAYIGRKFYGDLGPEIQADRLADERERAADQGLARNDGSRRGNKYAGYEKPMGNDREKGVGAAQVGLVLQHYPGSLAHIVQHEGDLYKDPAHLDIPPAAMAQVGIQGL